MGCNPFNACRPALLLRPSPARSLFSLDADDVDITFDAGRPGPNGWELQGGPIGAPTSIAPGSWSIGIGAIEQSDVGSCDAPCSSPHFPTWVHLDCVHEFEVPQGSQRVGIEARFGPDCDIAIRLDEPLPTTPIEIPVPPWSPPHGAILDDCSYRPSLLRIDSDGRPWYSEIATGRRIETIEFEGWNALLAERARLVSSQGYSVSEWAITPLQCVFQANGLEWVGGRYEAWDGWDRALGEAPGDVARGILALDRQHSGGAPPGAASLGSARYERVARAVLRTLDDEIREGGGGRWSERYPEFYLGPQHALLNAIPSRSGFGYPTERWTIVEDPVTTWRGYQVREFTTPRGRTVSVLDRPMVVWDDCANLTVPPAVPGSVDAGIETGIDEEGGIVTAYFYEADGDDFTFVAVEYADPTCQAHPVMGPIIDHLLTSP